MAHACHGWQRHRPDRRDGKSLLLVVHLDLFQGDECTAVRVRLILSEPHLHPEILVCWREV